MSRIVLFENINPSAQEVFAAAGYTDIQTYPAALTGQALHDAVKGASIVGIRSRTQFDAEVLAQSDSLRALGCFCIGTNQVDLEALSLAGVPVFNAPFSNTRSVAELVLAEAILLLRRIPEKNARVHEGFWDKSADGAYEARGKTLGIIGYGNIGSQVGTLAELLGMRVLFHDVESKLPLSNARVCPDLRRMLAEADVVTLHVPGGSATDNIINADALAAMKKGAILINASRGTVVDIAALHAALKSGHLAGAALDVFPVEPKSVNEPLQSPLRGLSNVILTPHIGGSTQESQANIGREVAEKLVSFAKYGATKGAVNFPEISYAESSTQVRLLHVHKNMPGAVSALNQQLADHGLNIVSQQLQTQGELGYVLIDVDRTPDASTLDSIRKHPATLRCDLL